MNWYVTRDHLKRALDIDASSTARNVLLDAVIEGVSRQVDVYVGFPAYPSCATRDYTARSTTMLSLDWPLLAVDSILGDNDENASYESTIPTSAARLAPYNAAAEDKPYWSIELRPGATAVFPQDVQAGTRIAGRWGYYDNTVAKAALTSDAITATATSFGVVSATALEPGHTILIDSERMFVNRTPTSATASHSSQISVTRAVNGTVAASHTSGAVVSIYEYPIFEAAALYQAEQDYRAQDAPLGYAGAEPFGTQRIESAPGGMHPFVRRMLDQFRKPTAI